MSKINYIVYRPDKFNLLVKVVLYWDQKKLLKQVEGS